MSIGVVSAKNRTIEALTDFSISDAIQTDAAINRGNSGGPLLDSHGRVIGINSQIRSSGGGSVGVGFAVSVDTVRRSIEQIRADGKARYAYIGISSQPLYPQLADKLGVPVDEGALVAEVVEGGPADKAGIKGGGKEIRFQAIAREARRRRDHEGERPPVTREQRLQRADHPLPARATRSRSSSTAASERRTAR